MKLISVQLARSTWLADINEFNPRGLNMFADLVPHLVESYKFKTVPQETDDFSKGMKFGRGEYVTESGEPLMVELTLYNDGVVADTNSSTTASDEFLEDIAKSLPSLGLSFDSEMIRRRLYISQVFVKSVVDMDAAFAKLKAFSARLSDLVGSPYDFSAFELWPNPNQVVKPANFSFQRRQGDIAGDRYWSQAALKTDKHIELLRELEAILS
jgi:hypothetical protein